MPRKVVLVACGSFNPVTNMHLRMFEVARDQLAAQGLDVVEGVVSPVSDAYGKPGLVSAQHRCAMLNLALLSSDWVRLDTWECNQATWTPTRQVLEHHQEELLLSSKATDRSNEPKRRRLANANRHPSARWTASENDASPARVMLLCGADIVQSFTVPKLWTTEDLEYIVSQCGLAVVTRSGLDVPRLVYESDVLYRHRNMIHPVTEWMANDVSATGIRRALSRRESVKYLLQDSVIAYIKDHGLYNTQANQRGSPVDSEDDNAQETAV